MMAKNPPDRPSQAPSGRRLPLALILGGLFTVLLIVTVFLTLGSEESRADEYGAPEVSGGLPLFAATADDPAIGSPIPEVTGTGFDATPVSITADGRAKVIILLAHWCPACQAEVPWVTAWLEQNGLPEGVDFYSVATSIDRNRENWPPSKWLADEGWPVPVIVDDRSGTVSSAFGLSAFPFWVFVNADGTVFARVAGGIGSDVLEAVVAELAAP
jgi:thiol-disulfide isomerase/thioredoxin